jgi:hypothetical protein
MYKNACVCVIHHNQKHSLHLKQENAYLRILCFSYSLTYVTNQALFNKQIQNKF